MRLFFVVVIINLFCFSSIGWIWQDSVTKKNKEGVKLYKEGKVDDALSKWRDAQIDSPDKEELHYNIGSALYGQKKYKDAASEYEKSLSSKNAELHAKTYYNMGNSFYKMGKLPEAIEYYKKVLDIDPDDADAKYNIEFVRKKIKENLQKKESQQAKSEKQNREKQGKNEEQKSQSQQGQQKQNGSQAKQEEKKEDGKRQKEAAGKNTQEQQKDKGAQKVKEGEMSKEDALRLLDALKDDEKDLQKQLRAQPGEGRYRVEKDW